MTQRTIDETGHDVPQRQGTRVLEVLFLRPCSVMGWVAEWISFPCVGPDGWIRTDHARARNILDSES